MTSLRRRWAAGETLTGAWIWLRDDVTVELMSQAGFDVLCVDLQHGLATQDTLRDQLRVARRGSTAVLVRVASHDATAIMRALDLGADGVVVPMVESAEQARAIVAAGRYAPEGVRSWGPIWAEVDGVQVDTATADRHVAVVVMVETAVGLSAIDEIAAVPGLDAVYVGPADLALSLGLGRANYRSSPRLRAAVEAIIEACRSLGVPVGVDAPDREAADYWAARGAQMLLATRDTLLLREAAERAATELRGVTRRLGDGSR